MHCNAAHSFAGLFVFRYPLHRHYPQTKATVVADTPEMARFAHNTKIQSQVGIRLEYIKGALLVPLLRNPRFWTTGSKKNSSEIFQNMLLVLIL